MKLSAYAKINLFLDVKARRADGYHDIETVMQTVSLADTVTVEAERAKSVEISLTATDPALPTGEGNIAYRAALAFLDGAGLAARVRIHIEKNIPVAGGLAGGSTDGAAVLRGLNETFGFPFGEEELCRIAAEVGADVPFCVVGGTAAAYGKGEIMVPQPPLPDCAVLIVRPHGSVSTAEAYRRIDALPAASHASMEDMLAPLGRRDLDRVLSSAYNVFERVIAPDSEVFAVKKELCRRGARLSMMSGSGPTVFGIFDGAEGAREAARAVRELGYGSALAFPVPAYGARRDAPSAEI